MAPVAKQLCSETLKSADDKTSTCSHYNGKRPGGVFGHAQVGVRTEAYECEMPLSAWEKGR